MNAINMEECKETDFFSFTRKQNISSIERMGLISDPPVKENISPPDLYKNNNLAIFFTTGFSGLLKTVDVFIRWEYDQICIKRNLCKGDKYIDSEIMTEVFKKILKDCKSRVLLKLDLIEGKDTLTSDYSKEDLDFKKVWAQNLMSQNIKLDFHNMIWEYGPYSDMTSLKMEDWNMNTHLGKKIIPPERLKMVETKNGNTDLFSILQEAYKNIDVESLGIYNLIEFFDYVKELEETKKK